MQVMRARPRTQPRRSGFTLIELLVVISIIAVLAALILPGIQNAREAARRTQCMNQMRNVSTALHSYATANNGRLPYLRGEFNIEYGAAPGDVSRPAPWTVHLLPFLEQQGLYERLQGSTNASAGPNSTNGLLAVNIQSYTCPDDPNSEAQGNLSFVANAGYTTDAHWSTDLQSGFPNDLNHAVAPTSAFPNAGYDWSFNDYTGVTPDDQDVTQGTGVFFQELGSRSFRGSIDNMSTGDGQTQTIVLSENLQAQNWGGRPGGSGNPGAQINDIAFVIPLASAGGPREVADAETTNGMGVPAGVPPGKSAALTFRNSSGGVSLNFSAGVFKDANINDDLGSATEGTRPRPSSLHPGVVNVFFGDGHGQTMAQTIDTTVYVRLVSSRGERFGQDILSDSSF